MCSRQFQESSGHFEQTMWYIGWKMADGQPLYCTLYGIQQIMLCITYVQGQADYASIILSIIGI